MRLYISMAFESYMLFMLCFSKNIAVIEIKMVAFICIYRKIFLINSLAYFSQFKLTVEQGCHCSDPEAASQPCGYHACSLRAAEHWRRSPHVKLEPP